jgi:intracellular sulfur oxidation DsrE/DsrF family protein
MKNGFGIFGAIMLLFSLLISTEAFAQKAEKSSKHKIVVQFSSGDTLAQKGLRNNLRNLTTVWPQAKIEVVCHGPGINFLRTRTSNYATNIENYRQKGVVFAACENTLKEKKIDKTEIFHNIVFVPNGLVEIITKQEQGWSYIKAGF